MRTPHNMPRHCFISSAKACSELYMTCWGSVSPRTFLNTPFYITAKSLHHIPNLDVPIWGPTSAMLGCTTSKAKTDRTLLVSPETVPDAMSLGIDIHLQQSQEVLIQVQLMQQSSAGIIGAINLQQFDSNTSIFNAAYTYCAAMAK